MAEAKQPLMQGLVKGQIDGVPGVRDNRTSTGPPDDPAPTCVWLAGRTPHALTQLWRTAVDLPIAQVQLWDSSNGAQLHTWRKT